MVAAAGPVILTRAIFHEPARDFWSAKHALYEEKTRILVDAYDGVVCDREQAAGKVSGDVIIEKIKDMFFNGIGNTKWGVSQIKIFKAFVKSVLPFVYGDAWPKERARVMKDYGMLKEMLYTLVNMARRNGKTYTTAATAAVLMLCVPGISIAIFSTCKRTSQMLLSNVVNMLEMILDKGTHANRQQFVEITRNSESIVFRGPDGTKRTIGCYPGSVRVS